MDFEISKTEILNAIADELGLGLWEATAKLSYAGGRRNCRPVARHVLCPSDARSAGLAFVGPPEGLRHLDAFKELIGIALTGE